MFRMVMTIEDYEAHQADYEAYKADMAEMSKEADDLREDMARHIVAIKSKIRAIDWALDAVKDIPHNEIVTAEWIGEKNGLETALAILQGEQV